MSSEQGLVSGRQKDSTRQRRWRCAAHPRRKRQNPDGAHRPPTQRWRMEHEATEWKVGRGNEMVREGTRKRDEDENMRITHPFFARRETSSFWEVSTTPPHRSADR